MVFQSASEGFTIMGKTADLTVVNIDTFHKKDKPQQVIAKEAGCDLNPIENVWGIVKRR